MKATRNIKTSVSGLVLLACFLSAGATRSFANYYLAIGDNSFSFGNNNAGIEGRGYGFAEALESRGYARILTWINADAKLIGYTRRVLQGEAYVISENSRGEKMVYVTVGPNNYVVINRNRTFTSGIENTYQRSYSRTFFNVSRTFTVGPVPVTVAGSIGGGGQYSARYSIQPVSASCAGGASVWATGSASGGVGVRGANVSLGTTLKLLESGLLGVMRVGAISRERGGSLQLTSTPLQASLWVRATLLWKSWTRTLASWSSATRSWTLFTIRR